MTTKEAIYLLRNTAWLAPSLEPIDEAIDMACEALAKMEQVDKDINVRSKDEPQWTKEHCKGCKYKEYPYDGGTCFVRVCINGNKYEPKDEPQTEREGE